MNDSEIKSLIDTVTTQTVVKLKKSKLMKDNEKSTFKKTEELLKNYNFYIKAIETDPHNTQKTQKLISIIENALSSIERDPYYSIIEMIYFEHKTREQIAEFYDVEVKTITRNKKRLINEMKIIIFSDDSIEELFS